MFFLYSNNKMDMPHIERAIVAQIFENERSASRTPYCGTLTIGMFFEDTDEVVQTSTVARVNPVVGVVGAVNFKFEYNDNVSQVTKERQLSLGPERAKDLEGLERRGVVALVVDDESEDILAVQNRYIICEFPLQRSRKNVLPFASLEMNLFAKKIDMDNPGNGDGLTRGQFIN
jgi:hypothetical protein